MPNPCEDMEDLVATTTENIQVVWAPIVDAVNATRAVTYSTWLKLENSVALSEVVVGTGFTPLVDSVACTEVYTHPLSAVNAIVNSVGTRSVLGYGLTLAAVDGITLSETVISGSYLLITDGVAATEVYTHPLSTMTAIVDAVALSDAVAGGVSEAMVDSVASTDVSTHILRVLIAMQDGVGTACTYTGVYTPTVNLTDSVGSSTVIGMSLEATTAIVDAVNATEKYWTRGVEQIAWQMNTETLAANWHTNYGFESMAQYGDTVFAVAEDGIYALTGSTDDAVAIDAQIKTGFWDMDMPQVKRVEGIYFGYHGGQMQVDVDTYGHVNGTNSYTMPVRTVDAPGANRINPGKGLASRYWRLTIKNVGGSYFDVDNIEFDVAASKRRI